MPGQHITIVTVCFERPKKLFRLWKSVRKFHPERELVVVDNSRKPLDLPFLAKDKRARLIRCGQQGNLSAARNAALTLVTTPLFALVDDDEWFTDDSLNCLAEDITEGRGDIAAGVVSSGAWIAGNLRLEYGSVRILPVAHPETPQAVSACQNFYVGRTEDLRRIGAWDESLPVGGEHLDSLLTFRLAGLRIWHNPTATIEHEPGGEDADPAGQQKLLEKWHLKSVVFADGTGLRRGQEKPRLPSDTKGFLVLGADEETGALLARCLHDLGVHMWDQLGSQAIPSIAGFSNSRHAPSTGADSQEEREREQIRDQVHRLAVHHDRVGVIYHDGDGRAEFLVDVVCSGGVKDLKFIWCLCRESPELEAFFGSQPSQDVLVIDPEHFRNEPLKDCEQLLKFCEIQDPDALARVKAQQGQAAS